MDQHRREEQLTSWEAYFSVKVRLSNHVMMGRFLRSL